MSHPMESLVDPMLQLRTWGAIWTGGDEKTAIVAENHHRDGGIWLLEMWDRSVRSLARQEIRTPDGRSHPVPEWFALPWVAEAVALHGWTAVTIEAEFTSAVAGEADA